MNKFLAIFALAWGTLSIITIMMPLPIELQFFSNLPNSFRWVTLIIIFSWLLIRKYPRHFSLNGLKHLIGVGISWENKGNVNFLAMNGAAQPFYIKILGTQLYGFNNSSNAREEARAYLVLPTNEEIPLTLQIIKEHGRSITTNIIPPKSKFHIFNNFGNYEKNEFIEKYSPLIVVLTWDNGKSKLKISKHKIKKYIQSFENDTKSKPINYFKEGNI